MRPVSLAARLFANMLAGHILVHIISGYAHMFFIENFFILGIITIIILSVLNFLEYFVAVVQSFLFIFIGALYYKDNL
jgi:F-type H+-transporting ATPase subunit a